MRLETCDHLAGGDTLVVLLPGAAMTAGEIVTAGFLAAAEKKAGFDVRIVAADAATLVGGGLAAVHAEILAPARAAYRSVWLGGISLGGLLALSLASENPAAIDGLCLLAPYPGSRLTTNAIARAGGIDAWQPTAGELADPEFRAWAGLKSPSLPTFVGYGMDDRFAEGMRAIAERFPPESRHMVAGGHDWPAWRQLWARFLAGAAAAAPRPCPLAA